MALSRNVRPLGWTRRDIAATFQRMLQDRYVEAGKEVRRLRLRQGLTHESLAHAAGVSTKTVQRIEQGSGHEHRGTSYRKIAEALGVPAAQLLDIISTRSPGA